MKSLKVNLISVLSFIPIFSLKSNLSISELIFTFILFLAPILTLNFLLIRRIKNKLIFLYTSLIAVIGIDFHIGLWNGYFIHHKIVLLKIMSNYHFSILILLVMVLFFFVMFLINKKKTENFLIIFLSFILIYNMIDQNKSYNSITNFKKLNSNEYTQKDVIIIFDEFSGLSSVETETDTGKIFKKNFIDFSKEYNFENYINAYSISAKTRISIPSLLNFSNLKKVDYQINPDSQNYFYDSKLIKNIFFEKYKDISVFQNYHIDFCINQNVKKCVTNSVYDNKKYLPGFNDNFFSKIASIWRYNGSISSLLITRFLRQFELIDLNFYATGSKASIKDTLYKLEKDILSNKYDLIFAHLLVPHTPYGFKENCNYEGQLSINFTFRPIGEKIKQHNIERNCMISFLRGFMHKLEIKESLDNINLSILSDHGSRITDKNNSDFSSIYIHRNKNKIFKKIIEKQSVQKIFKEKYN